MKRIIISLLLVVSVSTGLVKSQVSADTIPIRLEKLYGRLRSVSEDSVRLRINDSIKVIIEDYVTSGEVFNNTFRNVRYLGQIASSDSLIKIITWNLVLSNNQGRYFCYFIRKSPDGNDNRIYRLTRNYDDVPISADTVYTQTDWFGALYYDIRPYFTEKRQCWVLLGINYNNPHMTRKIIDVLSFTAG
ncbi:MAG: hypothetical protein IPN67_19495 [Bacteroidales bacterium]|nr:hypothetical protein [Bacteroidales bacterium]